MAQTWDLPSKTISATEKSNDISFDDALKSVFKEMREPPKSEKKEESSIKIGANRGG